MLKIIEKIHTKWLTIVLSFILFPALSYAWSGKVVNVADGDTITVRPENGPQIKVRLYGIDCPEKAQPYGQKARDFTASMVAGKFVDVEVKATDRYKRTVGLVSINGVNLNESIVKNGYAWVYRQYCKESFCMDWSKLESVARQQNNGMWADPHIIPPWDWRHSGGKKQVSGASYSGKTGNDQTQQNDAAGVYHGNVNSHKFHRLGCKHYNCKNCTATFGSKEDAVAAGYSPCGKCRP
jgi:endonuclease YncB( thermonuclease family)